jgi:hypothetical protein
MQLFVTPPGVVRFVHICRPFRTPSGPIWCRDLTVEISWSDVTANGPLAGLRWFGVLSTPTIHDSTGKTPVLSGKIATRSTTRVSGDIVGVSPVFRRGDTQCSAERWQTATHQACHEHLILRCDLSWRDAAIKAEARLVIFRHRVNWVRGTWIAGLSWWSGQRR